MSEEVAGRTGKHHVRIATVLVFGCVFLGAFVGIVWGLIAPRTELRVQQGKLVYQRVSESAVGADMSLACLLAACGLTVGGIILLRRMELTSWILIEVLVGGLLGSIVAAVVGTNLANGTGGDHELTVTGRAEGSVFEGALSLDSPGVLLLWSLASLSILTYVSWQRKRTAHRDLVEYVQVVQYGQTPGL